MRKTQKRLFFLPLPDVKQNVKGRTFPPAFLLKTEVFKFRRKFSKKTHFCKLPENERSMSSLPLEQNEGILTLVARGGRVFLVKQVWKIS